MDISPRALREAMAVALYETPEVHDGDHYAKRWEMLSGQADGEEIREAHRRMADVALAFRLPDLDDDTLRAAALAAYEASCAVHGLPVERREDLDPRDFKVQVVEWLAVALAVSRILRPRSAPPQLLSQPDYGDEITLEQIEAIRRHVGLDDAKLRQLVPLTQPGW